MTTATASRNEWVIRPTMVSGTRRYFAVAKLADGSEVVITRGGCSYPTVKDARIAIITRFDGGRRFPKPSKPFEYGEGYFARMEAIRAAHRGY